MKHVKKCISFIIICSFLFPYFLTAQNEVFYTDEEDELFNRGKFVGQENQEYLKALRFERNKHWAIALGTSILGIATVILVRQHHEKKEAENKN